MLRVVPRTAKDAARVPRKGSGERTEAADRNATSGGL
jgi:hypothetical protein